MKNTELNVRRSISTVATLEVDYEKVYGNYQEWEVDEDGAYVDPFKDLEMITPEIIEKIGELPSVKYYDYISGYSLESSTLARYNESNNNSNTRDMMIKSIAISEIDGERTEYFTLMGGQNPDIMDVKENIIKLVEGRTFTKDEISNNNNSVLVSKSFAELNSLTIGSTYTLSLKVYRNYYGDKEVYIDMMMPTEVAEVKEFEFTVVGIFDPVKKPVNQNDLDYWTYIEMQNRMYVTNQTIKNIVSTHKEINERINPETIGDYYYNESYIPLYVLNDPLDLAEFRETVTNMIPEHYKITDTGSSYDAIAAPMKNMEWIASIVLYVSIGATLVILSLLITLFLRDRKHEIGIYLSLGEKRRKVIGQILVEVMLVSFVAITLSLFSGSIIANGMSQTMLENQILKEQENNNNGGGIVMYESSVSITSYSAASSLGYGTITTDDLQNAYKVTLDFNTILMFYAIGLGTILISSIVPIIYIMRLNPKRILM